MKIIIDFDPTLQKVNSVIVENTSSTSAIMELPVEESVEKVSKTRKKKEKGCTEPLYGKKSKCIINIVPQEEKGASLQIDKKCIKTRD